MNKIHSKSRLIPILLITLFSVLTVFFIFITFKIFSKSENPPFGMSSFLGLFLSLCFTCLIAMVLLHKKITLTEQEMTIKYSFPKKELILAYHELVGYNERTDLDSSGDYRTFAFKIQNGKTFLLSSKEFKNYDELVEKIKTKTQLMQIGFYGNLKLFLICFLIVTIFTSFLSVALYYS